MVTISMWGKALRVIPRISKEEWNALDVISKWLISTRAAVFIMTALSCAVGGLLAYRDGGFLPLNFLAAFFGLVFAHATNNLINDYVDHKKGIDKDNYYRSLYGPQPLEHGLMTEKTLFMYILVTALVASLAGVYLVLQTGVLTLYLMIAGIFFVLFYTWPLKYIGLGEPSVVLVWGPLMVGGTYLVTSGGNWNWEIILISLVYAVGPTTVLFGKHTDKLEEDRKKGVNTLPVIIGEAAARYSTMALWILQYVLLAGLIYFKIVGVLMALVILAIPKLVNTIKVFKEPRPKTEPEELPPDVWPLYLSASAFVYNKSFGVLFLIGLLADVIVKKTGIL